MDKLVPLGIVVILSLLSPQTHFAYASNHTDKLLKQLVNIQNFSQQMRDANDENVAGKLYNMSQELNVTNAHLNLMTFELNNIATYLHILELSQTKAINGTMVR